MSQKQKNKNFYKNLEMSTPNVIHADEIVYMTDELINDQLNRLENERSYLLSLGKDVHLWEVEIAYIQREQDVRKKRADFHAQYMSKVDNQPLKNDSTSNEDFNVNTLN